MSGEWQRSVLESEGLGDWTIEIWSLETEAYCSNERKVIQLPADCCAALFLHEVAHALYPLPEGPFNNHYHGGNWAEAYGLLVDKYMIIKP